MTARSALALLLAALGCEDPTVELLEIQLVLPLEPDPLLEGELDRLSFIARHPVFDETRVPFDPGDSQLTLPSIEPGEDWQFELLGKKGGFVRARGKTCSTSVSRLEELANPPLLFSFQQTFSLVGEPASAGAGARLYPASGGDLLLIGGLASVQRYQRDTASFESVDGPSDAMYATVLDDGNILAIAETGAAWKLSVSGAITSVEGGQTRVGAALAPLADGRAILVGGRDANEELAPATLVYRESLEPGPELNVAREHASATEIFGQVIVTGGQGSTGARLTSVERTDGLTEFDANALPDLIIARSHHSATPLESDSSVLLFGGLADANIPLGSAELLRLESSSVLLVEDDIHPPRHDHSATPILDGDRILIAGGLDQDGEPIDSAVLFDLTRGSPGLLATGSLRHARAGHAAALMCDGVVLLAGGTDAHAEIYNPAPIAE